MRILVVDDELLIRYAIAAVFRNDQTAVTTTADGAETLDAVAGNSFDLCFLDIHLPDMSGLDVMRKVREASPPTVIVVMTGSEVTPAMLMTVREHAQALITKPFDLYDTKRFVHQMLMLGRPLRREEKQGLKDYASFVRWYIDDDRRQERTPLGRSIPCMPIGRAARGCGGASLPADVLNISDTGTCIRTAGCFEPGDVLLLGHSADQVTGIVRWSDEDCPGSACRCGVQFVTAPRWSLSGIAIGREENTAAFRGGSAP
jgi:CheY-like chemotaxis protein